MALYAQDGTTLLTASTLAAKVTAVTVTPKVTVNETIYETALGEGRSKFGNTKRVKYSVGQVVPQSEIDAHFAGGTGPSITSLSPTTAVAAGNTLVTVTGTNLDRATGVTVGGTAGTQVKIVSPTKLTFRTPARTAGTHAVIVQGAPANSAGVNISVT